MICTPLRERTNFLLLLSTAIVPGGGLALFHKAAEDVRAVQIALLECDHDFVAHIGNEPRPAVGTSHKGSYPGPCFVGALSGQQHLR